MKMIMTRKGIEGEIDFSDQIKQAAADKIAGYPPNCNKGYEAKDGKCVKIVEEKAEDKDEKDSSNKKKENPFKKKGDKKNGDKKNGDKKNGDKKNGDEKNGDKKGKDGKKLPPWLNKKK